ncbi:MAG: hypothetical protein ACI35S_02690 [Anaeroplasma sp.]
MIRKFSKLFLFFVVILFSIMFSGCTSNSFEIKNGTYICNADEYFGELDLKKISEEEFVGSNGLNVFRVNYDGEYRFFSINLYVTPINKEEKINLNFNNLEIEELHKITYNYYYFVDKDGQMININEEFISISYISDNVIIINDFYKKLT